MITSLVDTDEADFCTGMLDDNAALPIPAYTRLPTEWLDGDEFCDQCRISLARVDEPLEGDQIPGPGAYEITWRR